MIATPVRAVVITSTKTDSVCGSRGKQPSITHIGAQRILVIVCLDLGTITRGQNEIITNNTVKHTLKYKLHVSSSIAPKTSKKCNAFTTKSL